MTNPTKVIYGESGLLYIKSYLENISSEQDKYRDIFLLLEASLSRLVLLSAHLCSNCSHKFGRFWNEVQNDLEDAHILFVKSQNSSHKPPTISEIRENDFHLKDNFMSNGEDYSNLYKPDANQYKNTTKNTYNIFDAKFSEKDYNRTNSNNGSIKSMGYYHKRSQSSVSSSYAKSSTLTPVKHNQNNVTPIIDIESPPPHTPFLGSPALRAMSYPGSGHSSSIPSPYASLENNFEFKNYDNRDLDTAKEIPSLSIPDNTPEHHGPFKDEPIATTRRSVVADLIASQCVSRGGHSIVPASVLDIVFAAADKRGGTSGPDDGISPLLNACTAMASSSSDDEQSTENSLEDYLHGPVDEGVTTSPTPVASLRKPLDHPCDLPNDSTERDDSCSDVPPPQASAEAQGVGVGWEAAAVYGIARSPSVNSEATDDIFIEKEIIHGKIARIANLLKLPVYDLETSMTEVDLVDPPDDPSPSPKMSPKETAEQDLGCSSNIFETLEKFNERRRVQSLNQEPAVEEDDEDDADSDYEPRPSRAHHKSADKNNVQTSHGLIGKNKRKRKNAQAPASLPTISIGTVATNRKKNAKR